MSTPRISSETGRTYEYKRATIANGTALSNVIHVANRMPLGLHVPTWGASAAISFKVGHTRDSLLDLYTAAGVEVVIPAGTHNKAYAAPLELVGWAYVQVRSGVTATPVNQADDNDYVDFVMSD